MKNINKIVWVYLYLVCLVGTLTACKSPSVSLPTTTEIINTTTTKEVVRDTIFETKKDSSFYKAWLECVDGKVVISPTQKPVEKKGEYVKPPKVTIKDNILNVDCVAEAQKLFAQWKDVYTLENFQTTVLKTVEVEKKLTWWQNFQMMCGRLFLVILLFYTGRFLFKFFKPI